MEQLPIAVQRVLEGIETGEWDGIEQHLTPDVLYDGSVPNWRVQYQGPTRIVQQLREVWTGTHTWDIVERHVTQAGDTVVVAFEAHGRCPGSDREPPHEEMYRLAVFFQLADEQIAELRYYCCGVWDEATMRHIAATAPKVERTAASAPAVRGAV